jgi:hypothetical protein
MEQNKILGRPDGASRAVYEAPAIEASASFERLALMCARTPEEYTAGGCGAPAPGTANS